MQLTIWRAPLRLLQVFLSEREGELLSARSADQGSPLHRYHDRDHVRYQHRPTKFNFTNWCDLISVSSTVPVCKIENITHLAVAVGPPPVIEIMMVMELYFYIICQMVAIYLCAINHIFRQTIPHVYQSAAEIIFNYVFVKPYINKLKRMPPCIYSFSFCISAKNAVLSIPSNPLGILKTSNSSCHATKDVYEGFHSS